VALWARHVSALELAGRSVQEAQAQLERVSATAYLRELEGTIGADPFHLQI